MMNIWRKWEIDGDYIEVHLVINLTERSFWHDSKIDDGLESDGGSAVLEFHGECGKSYGRHEGIGLVIQGFGGKDFSMASWAGKVLLVTYVDPDESDLNEHFTDAMKKAKDQGLLKDETYKGIGIADCKATWKPDVLIRTIAGNKAKKYNTTILFDYDATLRNAWGLEIDTSNVILLDKNRVVRVIVRGKVPESEVASIVQIAIDLQKE